jgi:hypothetical protein
MALPRSVSVRIRRNVFPQNPPRLAQSEPGPIGSPDREMERPGSNALQREMDVIEAGKSKGKTAPAKTAIL